MRMQSIHACAMHMQGYPCMCHAYAMCVQYMCVHVHTCACAMQMASMIARMDLPKPLARDLSGDAQGRTCTPNHLASLEIPCNSCDVVHNDLGHGIGDCGLRYDRLGSRAKFKTHMDGGGRILFYHFRVTLITLVSTST